MSNLDLNQLEIQWMCDILYRIAGRYKFSKLL